MVVCKLAVVNAVVAELVAEGMPVIVPEVAMAEMLWDAVLDANADGGQKVSV